MTYKDLKELLDGFNETQLNMDVTLTFDDEYFKISDFVISDEECDVLDPGHPYFKI